MRVHIHYFALLKEERGLNNEILTTDAKNLRDLYDELKERHGFSLDRKLLKAAVNDQFAAWEHSLSENDKVVFVPPVAGG